ncbi:MAG: ATP-binding protein [Candidatus Omnitrophota bacterium]
MTSYRQREITKILEDSLGNMPVVILSGMRQAGKSTLLLNEPVLKKRKYVSFDDFNTLEAARGNPEEFLSGKEPITIDEAQKYPEILNVIKKEVDRNRKPGKFLLSGSANFMLLKKVSESLAGRAVYITLHPFTRRETLGFTKEKPALAHFIDTGKFPKRNPKPISLNEILKGGMPSVCLGEAKKPQVWFRGYEQTYLERDIRDLSQVADLGSFRNLLQLVALRNAKVLNISELARDAKLNVVTASRYLSLMETSFILSRIQPYLKNKTSRLIKAPKMYLSDTGLAAHLEGIKDLNVNETVRGALLESYAAQNLEGIFAAYYPDAKIFYWNIQGRYEVDFIIEVGSQTLAIEVKSGSRCRESDLQGLKAYLGSNKNCLGGLLAYNGRDVFKLSKNIWAVPVSLLLS